MLDLFRQCHFISHRKEKTCTSTCRSGHSEFQPVDSVFRCGRSKYHDLIAWSNPFLLSAQDFHTMSEAHFLNFVGGSLSHELVFQGVDFAKTINLAFIPLGALQQSRTKESACILFVCLPLACSHSRPFCAHQEISSDTSHK